ncbi:unnamed protein product [Peronospora destructor]|uniref:Uncharacterized protein n=1 Tax=Peronospora destructor TaxID=86335 RepID=A0AAV0VCF3_9STRA|nr:unnamed protein product [Peronospora destructor]
MWHFSTLLLLLFAYVCTAQSVSESTSSRDIDASSKNKRNGDIYNVCPVTVEFSKEQDNLSEEELKANAADAAMSAYLLSHPNVTLWDYFKIEEHQKQVMFNNLRLPDRIKMLLNNFVDFTADTAINIAQMTADAITWIINTVRSPLVGIRQVMDFFMELGHGIKTLWKMMLKDPKNTAANMGGGFLLHITHHPTEFTAETVLLIGGGFAVIHGLIHGVEAIFGTMSGTISQILMSVLMFIHAIDDPILIVTPLITSVVKTAGTIGENVNSTDHALTLTPSPIQPLKSCQIPKKHRPAISSRDLCLSNPREVRQLLFGTAKRSAKMTHAEMVAAYNHFHDFVCCYLEDQEFEVNAPDMSSTAFKAELIPTPVKMANCSQRLGYYSADTV